jgi:hypothetical protein
MNPSSEIIDVEIICEADEQRLARKTICFSKSIELHEKIIGTYIERYHFN